MTSSVSKISYLIILLAFFIISGHCIYAQSINSNHYQYLSPFPGSDMNMPATSIIIRYEEKYSSISSQDLSDIIVKGEKSGIHTGKLTLLENDNILSFKPDKLFESGEQVTIELKNNFRLISGNYAPHLIYTFRITQKKLNEQVDSLYIIKSELTRKDTTRKAANKYQDIYLDSLPDDFPEYSINFNNPSEGYIFISPFIWVTGYQGYLIISDKYGTPVFYRKMPSTVFDFQKQVNGDLTYIDAANRQFYIMDNKYEIIDSVTMQNGYSTDVHEFRILDNGHYLLMAYDPEIVRMDTVVAGGDSNAVVTGIILQELDENKNLVFQWRSWDHFNITDATYDISLTDSLIDYVHANAIELDYDGNILLSCRHMDEITKIDRTTGDIIWRWGGKYCRNNQFTFLNDSTGFSHQHCIRRLPNGNYILFDNGNLHIPQFSRAAEYQLDQSNKIATLVWEHRNNPSDYSMAMGSVERLSNHNTFIGWGTQPKITEVAPDGTELFSLNLLNSAFSYRAFKYNWDTGIFTSDMNSLNFGVVPAGQSATLNFNLTNNYNQSVEINSVFNRNSAFSLQQQLPVVISSQGTVNLSVDFNPDTAGAYSDDIHLRWETEGQRIAKVIHLSGVTDSTYLGIDENLLPSNFSLSQNYPNPFNPVSKIKYSISHTSLVQLKVFDILGNEITTLVNKEQSAGSYEVEFNGSDLASGIYFYRLNAREFTSVKKMMLLK